MLISEESARAIVVAARDSGRISGLTHNYYRYPARFSPTFAREVILRLSAEGDLVIDPFVGGGTTLVEARTLGRRAAGTDLNTLATFVSTAKTTILDNSDFEAVTQWIQRVESALNLRNSVEYDAQWSNYFRNISSPETNSLRKLIQLALDASCSGTSKRQETFLRCAILKTGQWALDSRRQLPTASEFREKLKVFTREMLLAANEYSLAAKTADQSWSALGLPRTTIRNCPAESIDKAPSIHRLGSPKLILTSPPYPGVHVLYHRWQVDGRRETPAAYWIANSLDGSGESHYTFGGRKEDRLTKYFLTAYKSFSALSGLMTEGSTLVQMVGFSEPEWQLPLYNSVMLDAGLREEFLDIDTLSTDGRLWRTVPNRKWHASQKGPTASSKEVVLFYSKIATRRR